jgi:hypothetical protein
VQVEAKQTFRGRSVSRRREIVERSLLGVAALILLTGVVVFLQRRADNELVPAAVSSQPQVSNTTPDPVLKPGGKLDAKSRATTIAFIRSAFGGGSRLKSYQLATPNLRNGLTKKQWLSGTLPFPPFPVRDLETTGINMLGTSPKQVTLEVLLVPELNSGFVPTRYEMNLVRKSVDAPWRVDYFLPYAPPGRPVEVP